MPPPLKPIAPLVKYDEPKYAPLDYEKKSYDQLIIPPPMPVDDFGDNFPGTNNEYSNDRANTASDIRPNPAGPDFNQVTNAPPEPRGNLGTAFTSNSGSEKPKV